MANISNINFPVDLFQTIIPKPTQKFVLVNYGFSKCLNLNYAVYGKLYLALESSAVDYSD